MEFLLLVITGLLTYITYKLKAVIVPSLRTSGALPYKKIRGKTEIQVEILLPRRVVDSSLRIEYEVTHAGLVRTLEIDAISIFNSLAPAKKYLWGDKLRIVSKEFASPGNDPGQAILTMCQKSAIQGLVNFSPRAFDLLIRELSDRKSVTLRVFGPLVSKDDHRATMAANSLYLLTEESISGPDYFLENYWNHIDHADREETKLLRSFAERFELPRRHLGKI